MYSVHVFCIPVHGYPYMVLTVVQRVGLPGTWHHPRNLDHSLNRISLVVSGHRKGYESLALSTARRSETLKHILILVESTKIKHNL